MTFFVSVIVFFVAVFVGLKINQSIERERALLKKLYELRVMEQEMGIWDPTKVVLFELIEKLLK